jgi:hypothetical protein
MRVNASFVPGGGALQFTGNVSQRHSVSLDMVGSDNITYDLGTECCAFVANAVGGPDETVERREFDMLLSRSVNYQSTRDRFLNLEEIAVQGSAAAADVRFVRYASRFYGNTKFFEDFPEVPLPDGVTLGDIVAIYRAFAPPELAPAIIDFSPKTHDAPQFSADADGDTASPQQSVVYAPVRTPHANPTMAESASIYKVQFSSGRSKATVPRTAVPDLRPDTNEVGIGGRV